uniref:Myotubularin phosphatase domain-containing protein n=1 Tax=Chromera velia CCMP2878 TaxID=1169474 RepID=A0A0G4GGA9_9ALVE|eukprot:Cvel_21766.t1-p1 / transcript=Cvel_21766.t1 / gene=Cvel_21766 / organism=Chromera_velia_CCMP2878 / gene_product=Myotubularin-related protein 2, putative / transcript_product=Myotubularin-related protein 2, putative / location=Cvel_scaffold2070:311-10892(+) / protein_length=1370 / sequence_SO=supercontig / SO=protein_coding / is_pseudo=false
MLPGEGAELRNPERLHVDCCVQSLVASFVPSSGTGPGGGRGGEMTSTGFPGGPLDGGPSQQLQQQGEGASGAGVVTVSEDAERRRELLRGEEEFLFIHQVVMAAMSLQQLGRLLVTSFRLRFIPSGALPVSHRWMGHRGCAFNDLPLGLIDRVESLRQDDRSKGRWFEVTSKDGRRLRFLIGEAWKDHFEKHMRLLAFPRNPLWYFAFQQRIREEKDRQRRERRRKELIAARRREREKQSQRQQLARERSTRASKGESLKGPSEEMADGHSEKNPSSAALTSGKETEGGALVSSRLQEEEEEDDPCGVYSQEAAETSSALVLRPSILQTPARLQNLFALSEENELVDRQSITPQSKGGGRSSTKGGSSPGRSLKARLGGRRSVSSSSEIPLDGDAGGGSFGRGGLEMDTEGRPSSAPSQRQIISDSNHGTGVSRPIDPISHSMAASAVSDQSRLPTGGNLQERDQQPGGLEGDRPRAVGRLTLREMAARESARKQAAAASKPPHPTTTSSPRSKRTTADRKNEESDNCSSSSCVPAGTTGPPDTFSRDRSRIPTSSSFSFSFTAGSPATVPSPSPRGETASVSRPEEQEGGNDFNLPAKIPHQASSSLVGDGSMDGGTEQEQKVVGEAGGGGAGGGKSVGDAEGGEIEIEEDYVEEDFCESETEAEAFEAEFEDIGWSVFDFERDFRRLGVLPVTSPEQKTEDGGAALLDSCRGTLRRAREHPHQTVAHHRGVAVEEVDRGVRDFSPNERGKGGAEGSSLRTPPPKLRICRLNAQFRLCSTYPRFFAVPYGISDATVEKTAAYRSRGRVPALSWHCPVGGGSLWRCSQPKSAFQRSAHDEEFLAAITDSLPPRTDQALILDARPYANALANKATGAGFENPKFYRSTRVEFANIQNIHVVREAHNRMQAVCSAATGAPGGKFWQQVEGTRWYDLLADILVASELIASELLMGKPVVVHCSDGWDRTPQLTSLAMLIVDPHYRTLEGFAELVEKEFCHFGHRFHTRLGHPGEQSVEAQGAAPPPGEQGGPGGPVAPSPGVPGSTSTGGGGTGPGAYAVNYSSDPDAWGDEGPGEFQFQAGQGGAASQLAGSGGVAGARAAPPPGGESQRSPTFLQWLDCVYQLLCQNPCAFEFSAALLSAMAVHCMSLRFGTFLFDTQKEREEARTRDRTVSFWSWAFAPANRAVISNPLFCPPPVGVPLRAAMDKDRDGQGAWRRPFVLRVSSAVPFLQLWSDYWLRHSPLRSPFCDQPWPRPLPAGLGPVGLSSSLLLGAVEVNPAFVFLRESLRGAEMEVRFMRQRVAELEAERQQQNARGQRQVENLKDAPDASPGPDCRQAEAVEGGTAPFSGATVKERKSEADEKGPEAGPRCDL